MFNSNIDNNWFFLMKILKTRRETPVLMKALFTLDDFHVPKDSIVEKAYLVWMGAVDPSKLSDPTDNSVKLKFIQTAESSPVIMRKVITAGETGKLLKLKRTVLILNRFIFMDDVENGCTETAGGSIVKDQYLGYFTYRVDITSFFDKISEMNTEAGNLKKDSISELMFSVILTALHMIITAVRPQWSVPGQFSLFTVRRI
jgi:hypothetical protein